jgi:hypothetical protein
MLWDSDSSRLKKHRSTGKVSWQQKQQGPAHSAPCWDLPKRCGGISNNHLSNSLQLAIGKRNRRVQVKYRWSLLPPANERQQSRMVSANIHSGMTPVQLLISPILTQYKVGLLSNIDVHRMFFWVILCGCQHILMSSGSQCDLRTYIILIQTEMMHTCTCKHYIRWSTSDGNNNNNNTFNLEAPFKTPTVN